MEELGRAYEAMTYHRKRSMNIEPQERIDVMKKTLVLLIALFIFAPLCHGADIHVNGSTGTDSGICGALLSPCKTVEQGVVNAGSGTNVVKIAIGDYSESIFIHSLVAGLTLQGGWNADFSAQNCNPNLTVLQPKSSIPVLTLSPGNWQSISAIISCLTFRGGNDDWRTGIYLTTYSGTNSSISLKMDQSIIDGFAGRGIYLYSETSGAIDVTIHNSIFKNAYQPPTASPWPGGGINAEVYGGSKQTITLENCLLFNNEAVGGAAIHLHASGSGSNSDLSLINVTLAGNRSNSSDMGEGVNVFSVNSAQSTVDITNSIVWGNSNEETTRAIYIYQDASSNSTVNASYSILGEIVNSFANPGTYNDNGYNFNVDPRLTSSYHLTPGSPAIDAAQCGYNAIIYHRVAPYDDIDGDSRPGYGKLTGCDIGADEYIDDSLCFPVKSKNGKVATICM